MISPGGTRGGGEKFLLGLVLSATSLYFFFDSVLVSTEGGGFFSGAMGAGRGRSGMWNTTSMGIVFLPFIIGVIALFYNARMKWAWLVTWIGVSIIVIEILSRIRFLIQIKTSHLLIMFVTFAAGAGLMLRSYREEQKGRGVEGPANSDSKDG